MIPYPAAIVLHLVAIMVFLGCLFTVALSLGSTPSGAELRRLRWLNLAVATPALILVWLVGSYLALEAGWFEARWLQLKLVCVAALSLIHALQSWRVHCRAAGRGAQRWMLAASASLVLIIFYLVGAKPG